MKPLADEILARLAEAGQVPNDDDSWTGEAFEAAQLPMVVACTGCQMTMTALSPTAVYDEVNDLVWCSACAETTEDS